MVVNLKLFFSVNLSLYTDFDGNVVPGPTRMYLMNVCCRTFMKIRKPINKLISAFVVNLEFDGRATRCYSNSQIRNNEYWKYIYDLIA